MGPRWDATSRIVSDDIARIRQFKSRSRTIHVKQIRLEKALFQTKLSSRLEEITLSGQARIVNCAEPREASENRELNVDAREYEPLSPNVIALHFTRAQPLLPIAASHCSHIARCQHPQFHSVTERNECTGPSPQDFTYAMRHSLCRRFRKIPDTSLRATRLSRVWGNYQDGLRVSAN